MAPGSAGRDLTQEAIGLTEAILSTIETIEDNSDLRVVRAVPFDKLAARLEEPPRTLAPSLAQALDQLRDVGQEP